MREELANTFKAEKLNLLLLGIIIIFAAFLRVFMLGSKGFWVDEIQSTAFSQNDISTMLRYISQTEFSPPLNYLVLHFVSLLGKTEFIFRLPFAFSGILTVFVAYKFGSLLFTKKEGLITAFLLAISPFHIIYSRDARMYSLFTLFSLLSYLFFYIAVKKNKWSHWLFYSLSTSLSLYTHYFTLFLILSQIAAIFTFKNFFSSEDLNFKNIFNSRIFHFLLSLCLIVLLFVPWAPYFIRQLTISQIFIPSASLGNIILWVLDETFRWLGAGSGTGLFFFLLLFAFGIFTSIRKFNEQTFFLLLVFFLSLLSSIVLVITVQWLFQPRYILFILPFYLILVARGISETTNLLNRLRVNKTPAFSLMLAVIFLVSSGQIKNIFVLEKENWKAAAEYLSKNMVHNDLLIVKPSWVYWCLDHYKDLLNLKELSNQNTGVWFVRPYDAGPTEELKGIIKTPFVLKKSFPGWNTINVWFSPSRIKKLPLPDLPQGEIKKTNDKNDSASFPEWYWSTASGNLPLIQMNKNFSGSKYSFTLTTTDPFLQNFILLSPQLILSSQPDSIQRESLQNLFFYGRIRASDPNIFPGIDINFYDLSNNFISCTNLFTDVHMTGDLTYWGWISKPIKVPSGSSFIKIAFKIPSINKKSGWVEFDDLKLYELDSNPLNQAS